MATTNTLARTTNVTQTFIRNNPLTDANGIYNEPALTIGDWVRQFILAPPFAWRWNRANSFFTTTAGVQDYVVNSLNNFGWIEKAVVIDPSNVVTELKVLLTLSGEAGQALPLNISPITDDNNGNITFRLFPVPDKIYDVKFFYQMSAPNFGGTADLWAPIPDYLSYLYNQGFLAKAYEWFNDERFLPAMQLFVKQVLAASEGLSDSQKNLFLSDRINTARQQQGELQGSQMGRSSRSLS